MADPQPVEQPVDRRATPVGVDVSTNALTHDGPEAERREPAGQSDGPIRARADRGLVSLTLIAAVLTLAVMALSVLLARSHAARDSERSDAEQQAATLDRRLGEAQSENRATARALEENESTLEESQQIAAELSTTLDRVRDERATLEDLFPVDLSDLGSVSPAGRFAVEAKLVDCWGWKDCSQDSWVDNVLGLTVDCDRQCSLDGLANAKPGTLSFDADTATWQAESTFGARCGSDPVDATWSVELRPTAISVAAETLVVERLNGTVTLRISGRCRTGQTTLDVRVARR